MKCIILGAGKVGFSIAATLARENHDVIVVDIDGDRLDIISEALDVQVLEGNGAHPEILKEAEADKADLLVAVTAADEQNMVACFLAKSFGVKSTIARVREPGYARFGSCHEELGIDLIINPERVSAEEILKLIHYPEAKSVKFFADGEVQMLELKLGENSNVINMTLLEVNFPHPCIIVSIMRNGKVIVPSGRDMLEAGDTILVMTASKYFEEVEKYLGINHKEIEDIVIFGGDLQGYYLAELLENDTRKYNVKIIENDPNLCYSLAEELEHTLIINGGVADLQLMEDENVGAMDLSVALTDDDKENVLVSILARELGAKKTICQLRRSDYVPIIERVGIDKAISPRSLTAAAILRFISKGKLKSLSYIQDEQLHIAEIPIPEDGKIIGKALKNLKFPKGAIIGVIFRHGNVIIPNGESVVEEADILVVMCLTDVMSEVQDYLTRR